MWRKLKTGTRRRGWLEDTSRLSWQVVPRVLLQDPARAKAACAMPAMMQMTKIDIARLQQA